MAKKTLYYYLSVEYEVLVGGKRMFNRMNIFADSNSERNPSGIPTMGKIIKVTRDFCNKDGYEYVNGSVTILSMIKLTKAQFDALNDTKEPADGTEE